MNLNPMTTAKNTPQNRKPFCMAVIGQPGAGKSYFAKELIAKEIENKGKVLLLNTDYDDWQDIPHMLGVLPSSYDYNAQARKIISPGAKQWEMIAEHFRNGLLVCEECKGYIPDRINQNLSLQVILQRRRHYSMDMLFLAHGITQIPPGLYPFFSHIVQFATSDSIDSRKRLLGAWHTKLIEGAKTIEKGLKKNPYVKVIHTSND